MDDLVVATLTCSRCHQEAAHDLRYAGRLLAEIRCHNCGYTTRRDPSVLRTAYAEDVKQRVVTKPGRMLRRFTKHPVSYTLGVPGSLLAKPKRLIDEWKPLLHRDRD